MKRVQEGIFSPGPTRKRGDPWRARFDSDFPLLFCLFAHVHSDWLVRRYVLAVCFRGREVPIVSCQSFRVGRFVSVVLYR